MRHLLCKYALCGTPALYNIGITQGKSALIDAMLNYETDVRTEAERSAIEAGLGGIDLENFGESLAYEVRSNFDCTSAGNRTWTVRSAQFYWLSQLRYNNPLRENLALTLAQHMPVNFWVTDNTGPGGGCSGNWSYKGYIDMMRVHSLGQSTTTLEQPVTSSFRGLLTDMLEDYQMALYLNHVQPLIEVPSPGFNYWQAGFHNSNFGREILQVFSLGQFNVFDGRRNYSEADVTAVSQALAGHKAEFTPSLSSIPAVQRTPWKLISMNNAGRWLEWDSALRHVGTKTIFENEPAPVRKSGDLSPPDVIDSIMQHDGVAYLPRRIFNSTVYQLAAAQPPAQGLDPNYSSMLGQLDDHFRSNDFRLREYVRMLMSSSASFSPKARSACISNGSIHLLRLLRTFQLPVRSISYSDDLGINSSYHYLVGRLMPSMNDTIGEAPSIFGYNECGDTDGTPEMVNYGQQQLMTQEMVGRYNMPFEMMTYYKEGNVWWWDWNVKKAQDGFTNALLLPPNNQNPTPAQLVAHFENLFGVTLSPAERSIVMSFIDPTDGSRPRYSATANLPAHPFYSDIQRGRILDARAALLVTIFSNLPDVNVR